MAYKAKHLTGDEMRAWLREMEGFVPAFTPEELAAAESLVVWSSEFTDPGADWSEFHLFNAASETIAVRRRAGF